MTRLRPLALAAVFCGACSTMAPDYQRLAAPVPASFPHAAPTAAEIEVLRSRPVATSVVLPRGLDEVAPEAGQNLLARVDDLELQSLWRSALRRVTGASDPAGTLTASTSSRVIRCVSFFGPRGRGAGSLPESGLSPVAFSMPDGLKGGRGGRFFRRAISSRRSWLSIFSRVFSSLS